FFEDIAERTLTTLHGRLDIKDLPGVFNAWSRYPLVSISNDQRRYLPEANWAGTVHHGMDSSIYRFSPRSAAYLPFLGAIPPEKRPNRAIAIANRPAPRLQIAAKV